MLQRVMQQTEGCTKILGAALIFCVDEVIGTIMQWYW